MRSPLMEPWYEPEKPSTTILIDAEWIRVESFPEDVPYEYSFVHDWTHWKTKLKYSIWIGWLFKWLPDVFVIANLKRMKIRRSY